MTLSNKVMRQAVERKLHDLFCVAKGNGLNLHGLYVWLQLSIFRLPVAMMTGEVTVHS